MTTTPPPLTLVVGAEPLLASRAVSEVLAAARAADPATERRDVDLRAEAAAGDLAQALSPSLFGESAVVIVGGLEEADDAVLILLNEVLAAPEPGTWVVALHGGGAKGKGHLDRLRKAGAEVVPADKLKPKDLDAFVVREFRRHRRRATGEAVSALRAAVGDDLTSLAAACGQLAVDVESDPIGLDDVTAYHEGVAGVKPWTLSDAVWSGDGQTVLVTLRWLLDSDPGRRWRCQCGGRRAAHAAASGRCPAGMGANELAREVGAPAWKLDSLRRTLRQWSPRALAEAAVALAAADAGMKGGIDGEGLDPVQKRLLLERTLLAIARSRHGAA
jgi:DNA polymerase-3 subunit delta